MPPMLAGRTGIRRRLSPLAATVLDHQGVILSVSSSNNSNANGDTYPIYQNVTLGTGRPPPLPNTGSGASHRSYPNYCNVGPATLPAKRPKTMAKPAQPNSSAFSADYIVRVKAQVMTRDDSSGGWVPMGGGGMSEVGLRKIVISSTDGDLLNEYHIHGQKILDRSVVLNCVLKKDVQYIKANPTFHHWMTEEKRFGLTFQSSAEARAFDKGVKRAVDDLVEGYSDGQDGEVGEEVFVTMELPLGRKGSWSQSASTASTTTSSPQSPASSFSLHDTFPAPPPPPHLHRMHYIRSPPPLPNRPEVLPPSSPDIWLMKQHHHKGDNGGGRGDMTDLEITDFSYVEFNKNKGINESPPAPPPMTTTSSGSSSHEYSYPMLDCVPPPQHVNTSVPSSQHQPQQRTTPRNLVSGKPISHVQHLEPQLPKKNPKLKKAGKSNKRGGGGAGGSGSRLLGDGGSMSRRARCMYCHELFADEDNARGQCEDAPDRGQSFIEHVSCLCCARGLLYHCMSGEDAGDYAEHADPCGCSCIGGATGAGAGAGHSLSAAATCKKWTMLSILSLFVPCLWCYWPLMACHRCGMSCACCGGKHKAQTSSSHTTT